jgi:hypothetical protein
MIAQFAILESTSPFAGRQLDAYQIMGSEHAAACLRVKTVDSM